MFNRDAVNSKKLNILAIKSKNTKSLRTWSFTSASSLSGSSPTGSTRKLSVGGTDISDTDLEHLYSELGIKPMFSVARLALEDLSEEDTTRSEEHTSELQSLMRISYAVFCLKKKNTTKHKNITKTYVNNKQKKKNIIHINTNTNNNQK